MKTSIGPFRPQDFEETVSLLDVTIRNTFEMHGIDITHASDMEHEIRNQIEIVRRGLISHGYGEYFLVARSGLKIVGTIARGTASDLIREHLSVDAARIPEIKSVYVLPEYHRRGIGSKLFRAILLRLRDEHVGEFCLDCGYRRSQRFWMKLLGDPTVTLQHHWGDNSHHMIWRCSVGDALESLHT